MTPTVTHIFITASATLPMVEIQNAIAVVGVGLEGDRYAAGTGTYSKSERPVLRHITLIAAEAIEAVNRARSGSPFHAPFHAHETRRNIVVAGISSEEMNALVGKTFRVGESLLRAVRQCSPCDRPSLLTGKEGFREAFHERGGLRAEVMEGGRINRGDALSL